MGKSMHSARICIGLGLGRGSRSAGVKKGSAGVSTSSAYPPQQLVLIYECEDCNWNESMVVLTNKSSLPSEDYHTKEYEEGVPVPEDASPKGQIRAKFRPLSL